MNLSPEHLALLRLARTPGLGPIGYGKLRHRYGDVWSILEAAPHWLKKGQLIPPLASIEKEMDALSRLGGHMVLRGHEGYPDALANIPDAPLTLSVLGNPSLLHRQQVALVGNRNASASGLNWSRDLAQALARKGVAVTSGLARGIDTAAHQGTLEAEGATLAVVAGGVDHIYPPENKTLRERIIATGAVISEQALGMAPTSQLFPRRNRIIAGLSVGVAVCEATKHSGSLITAQCALDYGREVWAVPGSPTDPRAGGPNWLLKNGATLVEGAADILQNLPATPAPYLPRVQLRQPSLLESLTTLDDDIADDEGTMAPLTPRQKLYDLLSGQPMAGDDLIRASGLPETDVTMLLVELELEGHAVREGDGRWRRG